MLKRDITQLAVYQTEDEVEAVPFECLRSLYLEKTSDIVYITRDKKLYGIVGRKEVLCGGLNGEIAINKFYTFLTDYNVIKAHEIFQRNGQIHKIPVVNEWGELLGDYSRWDDILFIERNQDQLMKKETVRNVLEPYEAVYVVEPVDTENFAYLCLLKYLIDFQIKYIVLKKEQIGEKLSDKVICIFLDEDERRGTQYLYGIKQLLKYDSLGNAVFAYDMLADSQWKGRMATYMSLLVQIMEETRMERLKIAKPAYLPPYRVDDKATVFLSELQKRGVKCFCLYDTEDEMTEYGKNFHKEVNERLKIHPLSLKKPWPKRKENEDFYGELYQSEDYQNETAQEEIIDASNNFEYKKEIVGKYFNAKEGRRITCFQPKEYVGTIYILGLCMIVGAYVEDQYTITSCLQKKLLEKGYPYRVENYSSVIQFDVATDTRLEEIGRYHANDIVICLSGMGKRIVDIEGKSLEHIFEEHNIPSVWVKDLYIHCNHKVNQLVADSILEMINPCLSRGLAGNTDNAGQRINFHEVMKDYIQNKYLNQYFRYFSDSKYDTVGAIVMNGHPFHKGHRYLIEQAKQQVDLLIIFVVEEDVSLFPFEERFRLIAEGIKDLNNVIVVPNGDFIFSRNNFPEFFTKRKGESVAFSAEYDINIFADYIAGPLHITHRFAGMEDRVKIMKVYNETMQRILSQRGINYVEIPKMMIEDEIVSSSRVRKYLRNEEYDKAFKLLPETTKQYLKKQIEV